VLHIARVLSKNSLHQKPFTTVPISPSKSVMCSGSPPHHIGLLSSVNVIVFSVTNS